MSYLPLRDRYQFDAATNERLEAIAELAEEDHRRANHEDACNCADTGCATLRAWIPTDAASVLAFALERGWLTLPDALSLKDAQTLAAINEAAAR